MAMSHFCLRIHPLGSEDFQWPDGRKSQPSALVRFFEGTNTFHATKKIDKHVIKVGDVEVVPSTCFCSTPFDLFYHT